MNDRPGNFSGALAPIAAKEEDLEDMESTAKSDSKFGLVRLSNIFHLRPLKERDVEEIPTQNPSEAGDYPGGSTTDSIDGVSGIDDGLLPAKPPQQYPRPGLDPKYHTEYPPSSVPEINFGIGSNHDLPDLNVYQHKKTVAQGMMDIALLSANANQLRYVLESGGNHPYYYASLSLITISLLLQVVVGVGLILNSRYNVSYETSMRKANRINNYTVLAIFLITVMNVFVSAFGIASVNNSASFPTSPRLQDGSEAELPPDV